MSVYHGLEVRLKQLDAMVLKKCKAETNDEFLRKNVAYTTLLWYDVVTMFDTLHIVEHECVTMMGVNHVDPPGLDAGMHFMDL